MLNEKNEREHFFFAANSRLATTATAECGSIDIPATRRDATQRNAASADEPGRPYPLSNNGNNEILGRRRRRRRHSPPLSVLVRRTARPALLLRQALEKTRSLLFERGALCRSAPSRLSLFSFSVIFCRSATIDPAAHLAASHSLASCT